MCAQVTRRCTLAILFLGLIVMPVRADDQATTDDGKLSRLEALLDAQQQKIEALEQQVAAAQQADLDAARVEQMKQQIREVLSEQEFRESLMPSTVQAGYDGGFFIRSSDDKFKIQFNGQLQFRYTYYATRDHNRYLSPGMRRTDRSGFDFARINLDISGHVYSKDLTYFIELSAPSATNLDVVLSYAWINYRIVDEFQIRAGVFKTANLRANTVSNAKYQFVEAPMMDAVFGLNDGMGIRFWGQLFNKKVEYYVDVVNSLNTPATQTITTDETWLANGHDNNPGILARLVWHALAGECRGPIHADDPARFDTMCDIEHSLQPALDFGMHYAYTEDWHDGTIRIPFPRRTFFRDGGFGLTSSEGLQINQFGIDAGFKYQGFSLTGEYVVRMLDVRNAANAPFTPLYLLTGDDSTNVQHGAYLQTGYFLPIPGWEDKFEVVGRVGGISALSGGQEGTWEYAGGFNYYIKGHNVKLQTDVTKISEVPISNSTYSLANVNDDALIWRVQLQVAF
ncbi:MAG: hypothetical protein KA383_05620 [Phycisphaerae bacterium]|nr:hypothetical protein [Phycisphaerae bacterium]